MMAEHDDYPWHNDIKVLFDAIVAMFSKYSNGDEKATIEKIRKEKRLMSKAYSEDIRDTSVKLCFSDQLRRWTYIYAYLPRHVHLVYAALMKAYTPEHMESLEKLKEQPIVCCVGGGPNCDALGLCIFLRAVGCYGTLTTKVCVLDKYNQWLQTWEDMKQQLSCEYQSWMPQTEWERCDLLEPLDDDIAEKLNKADIITMIKSLSALAAPRATVKAMCDRIMKMMKSNALLLFIDNEADQAGELLLEARSELNGSSHKVVLYEQFMEADLKSCTRDMIYSADAEALNGKISDQPLLKAGDNEMILIHRFE